MSKKLTAILLAMLLAFVFVGCGDEEGGVDFKSHNTNYSILVRNRSGERLVAFKGDLREDALIGGIPAHAENHGLPKNLSLFDKTESFPMILLTLEQYKDNINSLSSQKNTPFTRVFVFYNRQGDNTVVYTISDGLGGSNEFKIFNPSPTINVELRVNGVYGETIGFVPGGIAETTLRLHDGNYNIFPVFKRYNTFRDVVDEVFPKRIDGYPWSRNYSFGDGHDSDSMNIKDLLQGLTLSTGAAWVVVNNQTPEGGIRFLEGSVVRKTASGLDSIPTTTPRTFQINMTKLGNFYTDELRIYNWKFGPTGYEKPLQAGENNPAPVETMIIEREKMYTITVSGDDTQGTLKAWVSNITTIPQNEFGVYW